MGSWMQVKNVILTLMVIFFHLAVRATPTAHALIVILPVLASATTLIRALTMEMAL
jgi:hypothetical protein